MDLALNNLQRLICHKAQQNKNKPHEFRPSGRLCFLLLHCKLFYNEDCFDRGVFKVFFFFFFYVYVFIYIYKYQLYMFVCIYSHTCTNIRLLFFSFFSFLLELNVCGILLIRIECRSGYCFFFLLSLSFEVECVIDIF